MKQLKRFASVIIVITFLLCTVLCAGSVGAYNVSVFIDTSGVFVCESDGSSLSVRGVDNYTDFKYTFKYQPFSFCMSKGVLYAVMSDGQPESLLVVAVKNGKSVNSLSIKGKNFTKRVSVCVDDNGRIYLTNNQRKIEIYDSKGKYIKTSSNAYVSVTGLRGKVFASNGFGIYRLYGNSESIVCKCSASDSIYPVSADCIATLSGAVYNIKNGQKVFSDSVNRLNCIAASSKYIFVLKDNTVYVYNRKNAKLLNSYKLGYSACAVCSRGNKVYIINGSTNKLSVKKYNDSYFLPSDSTDSPSSSVSSTDISFGKYKTSGGYLFLPPLLTRAEFRSEISYDGYTLKFNKSSGLGTNTKAVFTKDNTSYTYTIIVKGDITGTGRINDSDIDIMFNCLLGIDKVSGIYKTAADMNGDGKLSNIDLVMQDKSIN